MLQQFPFEEKAQIVVRALRALPPGGVLLISELTLESDGVKPESSALFSVKALLNTPESYLETDNELAELVRRLGGGEVRLRWLKGTTLLETVLKIPHGDDDGGDLQEAEIGGGKGFVAQHDATETVEKSEEAFDEPTLVAELGMVSRRPAS